MTEFTKNIQENLVSKVFIEKGLAKNALKLIESFKFSCEQIIFITDDKIFKNCEKFFDKEFLNNISKKVVLKNPKADEKTYLNLVNLVKNHDLIIGLGSGTISDLCKITSAKTNIKYCIFASAPSMNGYLSKNASIIISGHKKTLLATLPMVVFCDLDILANAPKNLIKAGIGDSFCFYSCWFDWFLSHKILGTFFDKNLFLMIKNEIDFLLKNYKNFSLNDEEFLKKLINILLLSGKAMTLANGSYPASQSEHLIAHTISMKYPNITENNLHGIEIAKTTLTSKKLQKKLLSKNKILLKNCDFPFIEISNFFDEEIAKECKTEFDKKIFSKQELVKINKNLQENWQKIRQELQKIYILDDNLKNLLKHFKIKTSPSEIGLTKLQYDDCVKYAKFIRNRFTCLDLVF